MTGGRIKRIQKYVGDEPFMMTYGDGVCDVDIGKLAAFHKSHGKLATLTAVMLDQSKGVLNIGGDNAVKAFREKSALDSAPINAGYMVLEPEIFDYLSGDDCVFEQEPLRRLAENGELMSYQHHGFWKCMDTLKEREELETLEKTRLEQQLEYLKYQINPHFFMNTLNNIHALVDVNPEQAKMSILKLSKLMRYMLYDSNNGSVTLEKELAFLRNYVELMKMRYSEKVHIDVQIPTDESSRLVPPLLFISFVENAFKHGVSYVKDSRIKISVEPGEDSVKFYCGNTKAGTLNEQPGGIGLENSRKRLDLIYRTDYTLTVADSEDTYEVTLIIPYIEKEQ